MLRRPDADRNTDTRHTHEVHTGSMVLEGEEWLYFLCNLEPYLRVILQRMKCRKRWHVPVTSTLSRQRQEDQSLRSALQSKDPVSKDCGGG